MMRVAWLIVVLVLAGCAGEVPVPADTATGTPEIEGNMLVAADGARLPLRAWLPEGKPKAVILGLHGFNDYSHAFAAPAEAWAKDGIATYAYDQRGFGEAPLRGRWAGTWQLTDDVATASALLRHRYPGTPVYLLGESMGGAVAVVAVTGAAGAPKPDIDGIILSAPAVWGRETMTVVERVALWTGYQLFPGMTLTGRGLGVTPSDNIEMLRALGRDPLVIKETRVDAIKGLVDLMDGALATAPAVETPMLLLYGGRDEIVPKAPTEMWVEDLPFDARKSRRIAWYAGGYHMLLRDLEGPVVWHDIESWIADRRAPLPSGADRRAATRLFARGADGDHGLAQVKTAAPGASAD
jgi:alpha-beta hydrolase superfamily lysophospholipase